MHSSRFKISTLNVEVRIWKDEQLCTREIRYEVSWSIFRKIYSHVRNCACKKGARVESEKVKKSQKVDSI